jgi:hypothetical protein
MNFSLIAYAGPALAAPRNFKQDFKHRSHVNAIETMRALTYDTAQY